MEELRKDVFDGAIRALVGEKWDFEVIENDPQQHLIIEFEDGSRVKISAEEISHG